MRRIIESTLVSLDGAFRDPHIWATEYFNAEAEAYALELLSAADAMLPNGCANLRLHVLFRDV